MTEKMEIITDHKWRNLLFGYELTERERKEFDYLDDDELLVHSFFRYRRRVYDVAEFIRVSPPVAPHPQRQGWENWHGYVSDSFFSGVLVRLSDDGEQYQAATYIC